MNNNGESTRFLGGGQDFEKEILLLKDRSPCGQRLLSTIRRKIHILTWIQQYNSNYFAADLIAGVTLGLTMIPQSIAYAALAGLASHYGLYAAFVGMFS